MEGREWQRGGDGLAPSDLIRKLHIPNAERLDAEPNVYAPPEERLLRGFLTTTKNTPPAPPLRLLGQKQVQSCRTSGTQLASGECRRLNLKNVT
jgi:hypothetical protein